METRLMKIFRLVIMAVALVVLTVFTILHVRAAARVFSMAKELLQK